MGVGVMKCGTTTLHHYFRQHPDVFVPEEKESNFLVRPDFSVNRLPEYESMFSEDFSVRGEICPGYIDCADRISDLYPDMKIIIMLRDPIERMVSHMRHNHAMHGHHVFHDFAAWDDLIQKAKREDEVWRVHDAVRLSMYERFIPKWLNSFSDVLVMRTNDLTYDYERNYVRICKFLNVHPHIPNGPLVFHTGDRSSRPQHPLSETERSFFESVFAETCRFMDELIVEQT